MRVPLSWLHEYVRPALGTRELAARLAMTGTEVDRIHHHGVEAAEHFVVGKVRSAEPHPDADKLQVCTVDVGDPELSQIVCGAPNVAAGQTVAVARPGGVMPDGMKLKAAKLRGVVSAGMICSERELLLGEGHEGILVLDDAHAAGTPITEVLPIVDEVLELEITPNRPDCLGLYGVAREAHAATGAPLAPPPWTEDPGSLGPVDPALAQVHVEDPDLCPRFTARVFENVTIAPSPQWLQARLLAAGQRPVNNVVDITNYVMFLTGQPLHAFDLDRVAGGTLTVRRARDGETLTTLDGQERTLDPDIVLIEDADGPTSLGGVMGGQRSEVEPTTTRVLLEVASWNGPNINRTMARTGLRSEAGARYEKTLAPEQTLEAQAVASRLMLELTGATLASGTIDVGGAGPEPLVIR
ncbi:MAG: phenylalanine--tRNA ligase subunit beta, partial [Solirubrobacterales bacterium]|nr:phenylalanine--tRNA ligase subunit beta [Solirubrobacterales bacterium]